MINFTVGPVQMNDSVRKIGAEQIPYFRTQEFSTVIKENEAFMKKFVKADNTARTLFLTGSGTAAMEAVVMNSFNSQDQVLVVNGGSFGGRFVQLCEIHHIPYQEIRLNQGMTLTKEDLEPYEKGEYTGFLVNMLETSTGVLYDMDLISQFCKKNKLFLVIDAISSFLADPINMKEWNADVVITGSQKALACPPGVSVMVLSTRAQNRIQTNTVESLYFDLKIALKDGERGQTPFTPAVGILIQLNKRMRELDENGGIEKENLRIANLAADFRSKITDLPFVIASNHLSNAVTPLLVKNKSAYRIFEILKDEYGIWICPNGGELQDTLFRVGHIGNLTIQDNDKLIAAFNDLKHKKIF